MWIVPAFDELEDRQLRLSMGAKSVAIDEFAFEGCKETLAHRIVVAVTDRSHRRSHTRLLATPPRNAMDVYCVPWIRMMDHIGWLTLVQRHVQCVEHQLGAQVISHCPTNHSPSACVDDNSQEQKTRPGRNVRDVCDV